MLRKFLSVMLVVVIGAVIAVSPAAVSAQRGGQLVQVYLWKGNGPAWGYYTVGPSTNVGLYYYWYAATEAQVEDFLEHVTVEVQLNNQPLFESREAAHVFWAPVEPFVQQGQPLYRAEWSAMLVPLDPGEYTVKFQLSLDASVADGVASGMFGPGVIQNTTNIITVSDEAVFVPDVPDAETVEQPDPNTDPKPNPTAVPPAAPAPANPTEIYDTPAVGTFVAPAQAYWAPEEGKTVRPDLFFMPGETLWVFGMDSTRQYYKVIIDIVYLWVKADTIGPTYDETWEGMALPNVIVQ